MFHDHPLLHAIVAASHHPDPRVAARLRPFRPTGSRASTPHHRLAPTAPMKEPSRLFRPTVAPVRRAALRLTALVPRGRAARGVEPACC